MSKSCLLRKFLCCCGLKEGVQLIIYFQLLFMIVETIVAVVWTARLVSPVQNPYNHKFSSRFLVFPWFSFTNQLLVSVYALYLLAQSTPRRLARCYFWLFLIHTLVQIFMTIVEFSLGFSEKFEFITLTLIYTIMDLYFCWVLISFSKSKKQAEIPHKPLSEYMPQQRKAAYIEGEQVEMGAHGNAYHQVNKSSVSSMGHQGIFGTEEIKDATKVDFQTDGYGKVNQGEFDHTMDRSKSPDALYYESSEENRTRIKQS